MYATEQHIRQVLSSMAIVGVGLEGDGSDRTLDEAIHRPLAERIVALIQRDGFEASWAPDHDDCELAWVYC